MQKIILVFPVLLVLACQGLKAVSTPIQTSGKENLAPTQNYQNSNPTEVTTSTTIAIVPIPVSSIQIGGVPYQAYQLAGDPFRFVCQEPCSLDSQFIFAEYAGFRIAHADLIKLTGVDTLAELQPVDMHLVVDDSVCQEDPGGHAFIYSDTHKAYTCTEGPGYYPTLEEKIRMAAQPDEQYFPLHEYMHTMFFGRISGKSGKYQNYKAEFFHDFVVPIPSYAIGILNSAEFCSYQFQIPPGDFGGWLIHELCKQNGFQLKHLRLSLIALDKLYQSGGGQVEQKEYQHPAPTVAQYRDILNRLLGSDTTHAFADACWPPELFGNGYTLSDACTPHAIIGTATTVK